VKTGPETGIGEAPSFTTFKKLGGCRKGRGGSGDSKTVVVLGACSDGPTWGEATMKGGALSDTQLKGREDRGRGRIVASWGATGLIDLCFVVLANLSGGWREGRGERSIGGRGIAYIWTDESWKGCRTSKWSLGGQKGAFFAAYLF